LHRANISEKTVLSEFKKAMAGKIKNYHDNIINLIQNEQHTKKINFEKQF
jgi:hypothetical protein